MSIPKTSPIRQGEERGDDGGTGGRYFLGAQESTKEGCAVDVKVNWMKKGSGPGHPVAGKIRVPGSAQAPSVPLNVSPSVVLRTPRADLRSACHGLMFARICRERLFAIVRYNGQVSCEAHEHKSLLLEEKVLNAVKRMRCSRRSGVIF